MNRSPEALICSPVKDAEDARHSLDDMVALAETDPGAPFMPKVLEALVSLQQSDRAYFQGLRAQLKRTGCRVAMLDEALAKEASEESSRGPKQADLLIGLAEERLQTRRPDFCITHEGCRQLLRGGRVQG